jgi:hypothetical protein
VEIQHFVDESVVLMDSFFLFVMVLHSTDTPNMIT